MLCSRASIDSYKRSAPLLVFQSVHRAREVRITMFGNYNHFVQKGYGNFEDDETTLKAHKKAKVNSHLKALHLAKKWNHPKRSI